MRPEIAVLIALAYGLIDALYALYTLSVQKRRALMAGLCSVAIYLLLGVGILAFTDNPLYIAPAALGGFVGTYLTVKLSKQED